MAWLFLVSASVPLFATAQQVTDQVKGEQPAPEPMYSVAPLRFEIASDVVIGRRKSGVFCLPAGDLRWRDAAPDPARAANLLARALHQSGVDVAVADDEWLHDNHPQGQLRLIVAVKRAELNLCFPQWGPAKLTSRNRKFKGEGVVEIVWRVYDGRSRKQIAAGNSCQNLRFSSDQLTMPDAMAEGLAGAAKEVAISLRSEKQPQAKIINQDGSTAPICHKL